MKSLMALQIDILFSLFLLVGFGDAGAEWECDSPLSSDLLLGADALDGSSNILTPFFAFPVLGAEDDSFPDEVA